jgi:hypothetical protein
MALVRLPIERRPHRSGDATAQVEELDRGPVSRALPHLRAEACRRCERACEDLCGSIGAA